MTDDTSEIATLVDEGLEILLIERQTLVAGNLRAVPEISTRKSEFLVRFEAGIAQAQRSQTLARAIERLIDEARRNENLLRAAMRGVAEAKRRIAMIIDMGRGAVAYAEDGTRIASRVDQTGQTRRA